MLTVCRGAFRLVSLSNIFVSYILFILISWLLEYNNYLLQRDSRNEVAKEKEFMFLFLKTNLV